MDWLTYLSFGDAGWGDELLQGLGVTLALALTTLPVGLLLGLLVAVLALFGGRLPRALALAFSTTLRGLPELLTLFIIYHGVGMGLNALLRWYNPAAGYLELSPFIAGVLALGLVEAPDEPVLRETPAAAATIFSGVAASRPPSTCTVSTCRTVFRIRLIWSFLAAAGGHSILMAGPPGSGKSMLAQRFAGLLPPMTVTEALESAAVASAP